jgi:FlaA1/EpsC-like NDP-sugar epimerase
MRFEGQWWPRFPVTFGVPHNGKNEPKRNMMTLPDETSSVTTNPAVYEWESFLRRKPIAQEHAQTAAAVEGKRILVTGAGGWIGSALTRSIAA